jgi:divalent metal cation (Fe/Co/Zn/Cd) transporter
MESSTETATKRSPLRVITTPLKWLSAAVAIVIFGAGVPFGWVWVGSQLQGGTAPSLTGLGVALVGIAVTYVALMVILALVKERLSPTVTPTRHDWNRSLSSERMVRGSNTHTIEDIIVTATILVGIVCTCWFLLFGNPGVPVGY